MIIDTSAVIAILLQESNYRHLAEKVVQTQHVGISAATLVECGFVLSSRLGRDARGQLARFIDSGGIEIISFTDRHYEIAVGAFLKYGKGRHPAKLNYGDCLTYATAKLANMPLLFIGDDFSKTDLKLVTL